METDLGDGGSERLAALEQKIDLIYTSVERTRKYFLATLMVSVAMVLVPLLGLAVAIPVFLRTLTDLTSSGVL